MSLLSTWDSREVPVEQQKSFLTWNKVAKHISTDMLLLNYKVKLHDSAGTYCIIIINYDSFYFKLSTSINVFKIMAALVGSQKQGNSGTF